MKKTTKSIIAGTALVASIAVGGVAEDRLHRDVAVRGEMLTGYDYRAKRAEVADRAIRQEETSFNEQWELYQDYVAMLNIEKNKCNNRVYPFSSSEEVRGLLKRFDESGCP